MKLKGIIAIAVCIIILSCKKSEPEIEIDPNQKFKISGVVSSPNGEPLQGVLVTFENNVNRYEITTGSNGQYQFEDKENGTVNLFFDGNPLRYLNMRNRKVDFGGFDRTFDKMMIPWEIEEIDLLSTSFIDNPEKKFSLVHYNFDELNIVPNDFKNLIGSVYLDSYETTFTSAQSSEQQEISVSFYSMPDNTEYTLDNNHTINYEDVIGWQKILTISTTTTAIGVLEPVKVNLAKAYANYPDFNHSGTIVMVSEEINETLDVTSEVDLLEIRLPYGDDFELQN